MFEIGLLVIAGVIGIEVSYHKKSITMMNNNIKHFTKCIKRNCINCINGKCKELGHRGHKNESFHR